MQLKLDWNTPGHSKVPKYKIAELANELGVSTASLRNRLNAEDAPKPVSGVANFAKTKNLYFDKVAVIRWYRAKFSA